MKSEKTLRHVVIIPDGNRRWAISCGLKPWEGHNKSGTYDNMSSLFDEGKRLGIKYMSFWGFSTENWKRDKKEVDIILMLVLKGIRQFAAKAHEDKIKFLHVGRKDRLPKNLVEEMNALEKETVGYDKFCVLLLLDYGGRDEIIRAVGRAKGKKVDEKSFGGFLDTAGIPEPDLIIRTGGEKRLSGLMPFQSVYSELYFIDKLFPDFTAEDLREAVGEFRERERRFGN